MTMFKSDNVHESCQSRRIKSYLEDHFGKDTESRALAWDYLNLTPDEIPVWDQAMDRTRAQYGHDVAQAGKQCIHYYHFLISPDPRDKIDLETLRELTTTWAERVFGNMGEDGLLGNAQVAICYHDDNTNHVPHAHLIVNSTNLSEQLAKPRKIHIDRKMNEVTLPNILQEISAELGLSIFENEGLDLIRREHLVKDLESIGHSLTRTELALEREMRYSWKQEVRDQVRIAKMVTYSEEEFVRQLDENGIGVRKSKEVKGEWVYELQTNPARLSVRADRLGTGYSRNQVTQFRNRLLSRAGRPLTASQVELKTARETLRGNVNNWMMTARVVAVHSGNADVDDVARVLDLNIRHNIHSDADYDREIAQIERELSALTAKGEDVSDNKLAEELQQLQEAKQLSGDNGLFRNVYYPEMANVSPAAKKPATKKKPKPKTWQSNNRSGRRRTGPQQTTSRRNAR